MPARVLIFFLCLVSFARAEVQFDGYLVSPDGPWFALIDPQTGNVSKWMRIGETFEAYTIVAFDPSAETLELRKMAKEYRLALRPSKIAAAVAKDPADAAATKAKAQGDFAFRILARHLAESKFVIRVETMRKGRQCYFRCVEVWKAEGAGPAVGEVFLGPTLDISAPDAGPLSPTEAAALFDHGAPEELFYTNDFPLLPGKPSGGMPMTHGRLNLCPDVPLDDLRLFLKQ